MAFFGLIGLVTLHFRYVLKAEATPEWAIAGIAVGIGFFFLILMLHEAADALGSPGAKSARRWMPTRPRVDRALFDFSTDSFGTERIDHSFHDERRARLGLGSQRRTENRFR